MIKYDVYDPQQGYTSSNGFIGYASGSEEVATNDLGFYSELSEIMEIFKTEDYGLYSLYVTTENTDELYSGISFTKDEKAIQRLKKSVDFRYDGNTLMVDGREIDGLYLSIISLEPNQKVNFEWGLMKYIEI